MDEVNRITNTEIPDISEMTVLSMAKTMGHKKPLSGSETKVEYAVSYQRPELISPSLLLGASNFANRSVGLTTRFSSLLRAAIRLDPRTALRESRNNPFSRACKASAGQAAENIPPGCPP